MRQFLIGLLAATIMATPACASPAPADAQAPAAQDPAAQARPAPPLPDADPAMWVVRDADTTIYLFGTFHLLDGRADWFNDEVKDAFDRSQELVFEVVLPDGQAQVAAEMQPLIMRYAIDQNGRKLSERLTPEQNRVMNEALATIGAPPGAFDMFEPWFASMTLTAAMAQRLGLDAENGAESVLKRAAAGRNMTLSAVETIEGQLRMFDSMPDEQQLAQLKETLDNMDSLRTVLPRMLAVWNSGDVDGMERVMNEGLQRQPELRRILLGNRNRAWAEWIDQRLDRPGTVFMAVGAGHLSGPDSVQTFLRQRNIRSQRVPSAGGAGARTYPPCRGRTDDRCVQRR